MRRIEAPRRLAWPYRIRRVANLLNLSTPLGLLIARCGGAAVRPGERGLQLAEGYRLSFPVAGAFTVGNVVLTPSTFELLESATPGVLEHEERHTWQYVLCGTLFLPLYGAAMGWSWLRTGDRAARNVFERSAGLAAGGYRDVATRPWTQIFGARRSVNA